MVNVDKKVPYYQTILRISTGKIRSPVFLIERYLKLGEVR